MGNLLTFRATPREARSMMPDSEMGKLLLFTGVRYERTDDEKQAPAERKPRTRSRRRN